MAKDYFQDITPPEESQPRKIRATPRPQPTPPPPPPPPPAPVEEPEEEEEHTEEAPPERSIRNIDAPERRPKPLRPAVNDVRDPSNFGIQQLPPKPKRPRTFRWWPWIVALVLIVILAGLALFALRKTTVTIVPRSHSVVFDQTSQFTAYPSTTAASGTLAYSLITSTLQASQSVPSQGSQNVETKAQGTATVYNDYSTSPVKLIANTRFLSPNGLTFRIASAVLVPGKTGTTPGHVTATIFADDTGPQYNIGPVSRFTIPGLQTTPAMYSNIYAQTTASTTGGFSGQQAAVDPGTLSSTIAALRSQLAQEAQTAANQNGSSTIALPGLIEITYQDLPQAPAANNTVQVNEQASIQIPVFDNASFTQTIAQSVGENGEGAALDFVPGKSFSSQGISEASSTLGTDPFSFQLSGNALLVWRIDSNALAQALAGHDQNAFTTITSGFPGVQEAHARIEPFWKTSFPSNPADIVITVQPPATPQ